MSGGDLIANAVDIINYRVADHDFPSRSCPDVESIKIRT